MNTLVFYKAIAAFLIFIASIASILYPLRKKRVFHHADSLGLGEAIASGIFLGAAFFHMLPEAERTFNEIYGLNAYPIPQMVAVVSFLLMLFLERLSLSCPRDDKHSIPYLLAIILIIHALVEGAALGIGPSFSETMMIFIAILAHKGSESFALCVTLLRHQLPLKRIIFVIVFFSLMTPIGILLGTAVNLYTLAIEGKITAALFNAFAAGTFLYISTLHHIHFHKHQKDTRGVLEFVCLVLGTAVMGIIALWT